LPTPKAALDNFQRAPSLETLREIYMQSYAQFMAHLQVLHLPLPLLLAGAGALLLAWWLFIVWVRARGAFMVLHRWHQPAATIAASWAVGSGLARSLFLFRLCLTGVMLALLALIGAGVAISIVPTLFAGVAITERQVLWLAFWALALITHLAVWGTIEMVLNCWVTPIMYWRRVGALAAWRVALDFCDERPGGVIIFLTLYPWVWLAALLGVLFVCICTCCIGCVGLCIPYINAVLLLPAILFLRGIGIAFMRQWRPDLAPNA
jgi:hypothetical protein